MAKCPECGGDVQAYKVPVGFAYWIGCGECGWNRTLTRAEVPNEREVVEWWSLFLKKIIALIEDMPEYPKDVVAALKEEQNDEPS